jgi:hypothetical protein
MAAVSLYSGCENKLFNDHQSIRGIFYAFFSTCHKHFLTGKYTSYIEYSQPVFILYSINIYMGF